MLGDHAFRHVGDEPAEELAPGFLELILGRFVVESAAPEVADEPGCGAAEAVALGDQGWMGLAEVIGDQGEDTGAGFHITRAVEDSERRQLVESRPFGGFRGVESEPGLEPAFAGEIEAKGETAWGGWGVVEVDGEHGSDGCAVVIAFAKGLGAAEHEESGATFGDELLQEAELITGEES
jgi:hypothetical protein